MQNLWAFSNLCINRYPVTPTTYTFKAPSSPSVIGSFKETLRRAFGVLECKHMCRLGVGRGWGRVYRRSLSLSGGGGRKRGTRGVSHATGAHTTPNATTAPLVALLPLHRAGTGMKLVECFSQINLDLQVQYSKIGLTCPSVGIEHLV